FGSFGECFGAAAGAFGEAGDLDVAGGATVGVDVPGESVVAAFEHRAAAAFVVAGGGARFDAGVERVAGTRGVYPVIDYVDHAADGVAAVEERGGAANDLDPLD